MFGLAGQSYRVGQRPAAVNIPSQIPNLQAWYNGDIANTINFNSVLVDGNDVGQWRDRTLFARNLNQSGGSVFKPKWRANQIGAGNTYGVVRFNGTTESLDINPVQWLQSQTGFSLFVVAKATTVGITSRTICATNTGGFQISHNNTNWRVEAGSCSGVSTITGVSDTGKFNIYGLIFEGSGIGNSSRLKFRYNKIPQTLTYTGTANTITSPVASTFYVGVGSISDYFTGDIAEILMYTRTLNSTEIALVESYLTAHWNL